MGTSRTLHPRQILHSLGAISVHGGILQGEPQTRALRSGAECLFDLATEGGLQFGRNHVENKIVSKKN